VDVLKEIKIKILPLLGKGIALFLFALIGSFLFYFSVFSKNPFTLLGFILIILFAFFFTEYAIYIFVLTLPLLSQVPKLLNFPLFSPSELLFLCLLMACLLKVIFNKKKIVLFESPLDLPITIFSFIVISSFLSTFITHYPLDFFYKEKVLNVLKRMLFIRNPYDYSYIFTSTFTMLEGVLLFFFVTNFIKKQRVLNRIYFLLILGWGIVIILGFIQYFGGVLGNERWPTRMFSMFDNPNLFGGYLVLLFPLTILYGINKPFFKKISLSIFAILSIISLILSRSKNSWIAFAILLVFMGIFFLISFWREGKYKSPVKIVNWKWICVFAICFVIIYGSFYIYLKKGKVLELLSEDLNWHIPIEQKLDIRLPIWKHSIQMVEDFPLFGVGIGSFNLAFPKYSSGYQWEKTSFSPHNWFLQIATELGLIGLYAFLWILGTIFIKGLHIIRGKQNFVKLGIWFGIMGFVLTFFGDNHLWNIEMQLMFWLLIGLLFVDEAGNEMAQTHRKSFDKKLLIGLSIILFLTIPFQIYQRSQISFLPEKTVGLYKEVFEEKGKEYRWGEKVVMIPLEVKGKWINIPIWFGNPDIKKHPVKAKIFVNRRIIDHLDFKDNDWHTLQYPIQNMEAPEIFLKIEVSRTWNPYLMGVRHETRDLGPALGKVYWSS
jgi:putative inorganic carbon (HCO3(-)) transporter